jgi:hypothetical protein
MLIENTLGAVVLIEDSNDRTANAAFLLAFNWRRLAKASF